MSVSDGVTIIVKMELAQFLAVNIIVVVLDIAIPVVLVAEGGGADLAIVNAVAVGGGRRRSWDFSSTVVVR